MDAKPKLFSTWEDAVLWLKRQPEQEELVCAAYYDDPLPTAAERYWKSDEWSAIRHFLQRSGGRALDVGAGRGIASYALAKDGYDVIALEPDGSALVGAEAIRGLAASSGLPIEVTQEFSERLPFNDEQFDLVFARAVLHHTSDMMAACREFHRVLKPGGVLCAVREHVISRDDDLPAFLDSHPLHRIYGGENAFLVSEYKNAIISSGCELRQVLLPFDSPINFAPYTVRALQSEIAQRLCGRFSALSALIRCAFCLPGVWPLARKLLNRIDHRPGRLYSFIARRPI